jgi:hypothetical protein
MPVALGRDWCSSFYAQCMFGLFKFSWNDPGEFSRHYLAPWNIGTDWIGEWTTACLLVLLVAENSEDMSVSFLARSIVR